MMPDNKPGVPSSAPLVDAARLPKSYANTFAQLAEAVRNSTAFFGLPGVGVSQGKRANPDTWVKDFSPDEVVVACWGRPDMLSASYVIDSKGGVTFGTPFAVMEQFVPVAGDEMTDALALTDAEIEVLNDGRNGAPRRLRLLSSKANTVINKRVYPMTLVRPAIASLRPKTKSGMIFSETPHPAAIRDSAGKVVGFRSNPEKRISRVVNVEVNDKGEVWTEHEFLDSTLATSVYDAFVNRSGKYGISQRAIGELEQQAVAGGSYPVAKTLEIHTYDFVENPALGETVSRFEVLLDDALGAIAPATQPPTSAPTAASHQEVRQMDENQNTPATLTPAPAQPVPVAATLSTEQAEAIQEAMAILKADKAAKAAEVTRKAVKSVVATEAPNYFTGIPEQFQARIIAKAEAAPTAEAAIAILSDETDAISTMNALAKLNAMGVPAAAQGVTTPTAGSPRVDVQVTANPTPHLEIAKRFGEASDRYNAMKRNIIPDAGLRAHNKPFVDALIADFEQASAGRGVSLVDAADALLDSSVTAGLDALLDSTTTGSVWNQPSIVTAILMQKYQDLEMMTFCGGIGKSGFAQGPINGEIGSVLRVPTEIYGSPSGSLDLPGFDSSLFVAEDAGIPESTIQTAWQTYAPDWRKIACEVTQEAQQALKNGPLNYDVLARLTSNMIQDMQRRIDRALAEEMLGVADEYAAVATSETTAAGNLIANSGGALLYGNTVTWYAKLIGAGSAGTPLLNPVVRRRKVTALSGAGVLSSTIINQVGVTGGLPTTQVEGYLDKTGQIVAIPGVVGAVTYAVDYVNGRVCFNAASNIDATHLPTIAYTYATNFDVWNTTVPNGITNAQWYNTLIERVDRTAALMSSAPRYNRPNLVLGTYNAMVPVENAGVFYEQASPMGTTLIPATRGRVVERGGLGYAKHNTPWSAGDSCFLVTQLGATRYGVDTPLGFEGPFPSYDSSGKLKSNKKVMGTENSVICTPQPTDQSGNTLNPVARKIYFKP
jgi:hypothetical protein